MKKRKRGAGLPESGKHMSDTKHTCSMKHRTRRAAKLEVYKTGAATTVLSAERRLAPKALSVQCVLPEENKPLALSLYLSLSLSHLAGLYVFH